MSGYAQAKAEFILPAAVRQEGKWFYSSCTILDIHSQGMSKDEALGNLIEAIQLFLESCFTRGVLDRVLLESGFVPGELQSDRVEIVPGEFQSDQNEEEYVNVPVSLIAQKHAQAHAH